MQKYLSIFVTLLIFILYSGCSQEPEYDTLVEQGLNSGEQHNELFLDYELGMTREEFRDLSWEHNSRQIISGLVKIDYPFDELKARATKRFYPDFKDNRISRVPIDVHYEAWSPWNESFSSDSLVVDLVDYYSSFYDTKFNEVYVPYLDKKAHVSVDGNRAITVYRHNDMIARVEFVDLKTFEPDN